MDEFFSNTISDKTKSLYRRNLVKLNGDKVFKNLKFLAKTKDILAKLEAMNPNTRRTNLISIVHATKHVGDKKLFDFYTPLMMKLNKDLMDNTKKSDKQEENWMSQDDVLEVQKHLLKVLPKSFAKTMDYEKLLDLMILSLYTLTLPRRNLDYLNMLVTKPPPTGDEPDKHNYMWEGKFYFNNYKTAKTYKQQIEDIPDELQKVIDMYMAEHPDVPEFLVRANGSPLKTSNDITRRLNKIFGRNISSSMLRNIYLTSKYSKTMNEMKDDVKAMGTSLQTAEHNYIKNAE
jgi:hypothetical protein